MPKLKLIPGVKISKFNASERVKDKEYISDALWESIVADDSEGFKEILRAYLELINKDELSKEIGIPKRTLFRILSKDGNPTLETISKIVHKLCA